jgi:hypothetical protein
MLEVDGALRTWALERLPDATADQTAEQLPDHRIAYLDYEGPVSGDRGQVTRWDAGEFRWLAEEPRRMAVELSGARLHGVVTLERDSTDAQRWRCWFSPGSR